ncbi:MAG: SDR family oxidoreductase [Ruminococcaceae bacterium]|nr:SDR family oxidoreductase [Oscillospiraceae bacterium]
MKGANIMEQKVIVITGAGGVLCSGFAKVLAKEGHKVALLDLNLEAAEGFAAEIRAEGGIAKAYGCNVLKKESMEEAHQAILKDFGKCDILINGAGGNNPRGTADHETYEPGDETRDDIKTFFNLDPDGIGFVFNLNFLGTLLPTQVFVPDMIGKEGCSILNISSMNAFRPLTKIPAYSGAKAAISNFTQWLAVHFAPAGIRVNAIAPGFFVTNQNRALLFNEDGTPTARTNKILNATPMKRFGESEELNGALTFLLDAEKAGFITGVVLPVDGGFSAYSGV